MQFRLQFDTDNAAFEGEELGLEIARILYAIANDINQRSRADIVEGSARDINGNQVGTWSHDV